MTAGISGAARGTADVLIDAIVAGTRAIKSSSGPVGRAFAAAWGLVARWLGLRPDVLARPSYAGMRRIALAGLAVNAFIVVSGGLVRVSDSGLGCPTWPRCTPSSLLPDPHPDVPLINMLIEFGNRMVTFAILVVSALVFRAAVALRDRRPDLARLAVVLPLGVLAQGLLGGVTVLSGLHPAVVGAHYLLSSLVLIACVALVVRSCEGDRAPTPTVGMLARRLGTALPYAGFVLLAAGTVVTGSGPHAGDAEAERYGFAGVDTIQLVVKIHSAAMWITLALTAALVVVVQRERAAGRSVGADLLARRLWVLVGVILAQGAIGYLQYFLGVPAGFVLLHIAGSVAFWITALFVRLAIRDRGPAERSPYQSSSERAVRASVRGA